MHTLIPAIYFFLLIGLPTIWCLKILFKFFSHQKNELHKVHEKNRKKKIYNKLIFCSLAIIYGVSILVLIVYFGVSNFIAIDSKLPVWLFFIFAIIFAPYWGVIYGLLKWKRRG
jgi:hypothetical protein